jgi:ubiquitin-protein ligase
MIFFIVDCHCLCRTSQDSSDPSDVSLNLTQGFIIDDRILLKLEHYYCQRSFRIRFILSHKYPFKYPQLRFSGSYVSLKHQY